jgi:hypothetical protein
MGIGLYWNGQERVTEKAEMKFLRSLAIYKLYDHEQMTNMRTTTTEFKANYCGL